MATPKDAGSEVRRIGVVGAGAMGHGIAQVAAMAGYRVALQDVEEDALTRAVERIRMNLDAGIERGKVAPETKERALTGLRTTTQLEELANADLVIEAVPEDLALKREIFGRLDELASAEAVLATNTSSLSVGKIAETIGRPDRVLGMHFFNPVHIMKLVELVRAQQTAPGAILTARRVAKAMGKTPIVVKDSPGFASSRLGVTLGLEAMRMLEEGVASAEDIDTAMELGYRHPMGPLELSDLVGLDVRLAVAEYLYAELGDERFRPPEILRRKVDDGELGKKSGRGFYDWAADDD
jgi:3-hydroxybutyryl-CoA dehydrogenase